MSSTLWNIFYHVYIPDSDLAFLQRQSRKLMELAVSADSWSSSPYGKWIRFLDEDTRSRVDNIWSQYAKTEDFTESEKQEFELRGRKGFDKIYATHLQKRRLLCMGRAPQGPKRSRLSRSCLQHLNSTGKPALLVGNVKMSGQREAIPSDVKSHDFHQANGWKNGMRLRMSTGRVNAT